MPQLIGLDNVLEKKLLKKHHRFTPDFKWLIYNEETLRDKYTDKYVAIENKAVKFSAKTLKKLISKVEASSRDIDDFIIEYIKKEKTYLL